MSKLIREVIQKKMKLSRAKTKLFFTFYGVGLRIKIRIYDLSEIYESCGSLNPIEREIGLLSLSIWFVCEHHNSQTPKGEGIECPNFIFQTGPCGSESLPQPCNQHTIIFEFY